MKEKATEFSKIFKSNPEHARTQVAKLRTLRETRDQAKAQSSLEALRRAAGGEENLMPFFIEAVKAYATLGEICGVLRETFGEYQPVHTIG